MSTVWIPRMLKCDGCNRPTYKPSGEPVDEDDLRHMASTQRWTRTTDGRDLCPACSEAEERRKRLHQEVAECVHRCPRCSMSFRDKAVWECHVRNCCA